ncbi:MAG: dihydropteroate synthase [Chloroherpetonaceae bacterium]|nr:dihydropteroate synthase [Chloroherpetonaceae bacterium]MDW8437991.1 dihydropteroate synthase [Chloroherpetonaceae bacterium]
MFSRFVCREFELDFSKPNIMGVLNLTPDSFSDGGRFFSNENIDFDKAVEAALQMQRDGANIIDVGGESTRPNATPVSAEEEIRRTVPLIERLAKRLSIPISIDTYKAVVAEKALQAGASLVNDISGFRLDGALADVCAKFNAPAVVMHSKQKPSEMRWSYEETTTYADVVDEVKSALARSIEFGKSRGVASFIVDVGFGFGKTVEANYELLARLNEFESLGCPILVGLSRKSFIGKALDEERIAPVGERLYGTIAANVIAMMNGANILRVHDCKPNADAVKIFCKTQARAKRQERES